MDGLVRVLEVDPDLGQGLDSQAFAAASRELVADTLDVARGVWELDPAWAATGAVLGLLILAGVLARDLIVGRRRSLEILGPGDIVRPWPEDRHVGTADLDLRFNALEPVRFASLDAQFATHAVRYPGVISQVTGRVMGRATSASLRLLVHQVVRIDDRVLVSLWGLAERFGRVTPDGVLMPVPINHTMMARFVGAQRPTVSQAVGELTRRGEVERLEGGGWLLKGEFPEHVLPGVRTANGNGSNGAG
ncbi:MAG: Crp/Fnr family transcriptional regulator [Conexibacter sp.]|nr:Crp/Fnr family transcriptional regulator [Conexibacter sp.]